MNPVRSAAEIRDRQGLREGPHEEVEYDGEFYRSFKDVGLACEKWLRARGIVMDEFNAGRFPRNPGPRTDAIVEGGHIRVIRVGGCKPITLIDE